ncbi:MAG TPA: MarR family winged helix-turn-helix transcriptional regulator [Ramlibacter sp.]|uniref:MarR family winged helix-turn-helix transcriptional regulator n=1 Tax=Ramlibacter sp. TaxID=1917967 RepID=UPI002D0920A9|nr:MarR family winged helix-turn-helix transcriptional regulator [Ramlibacter sp.]HVZ42632.1 MarR family winged helix-turn-helix transcriptional regulator [Ramlibacter sp.]
MTPPRKGAARHALLHTDESPFYQLWVLTNLTARPFAPAFGQRFHMNLNDWRVMLTLADHPGVTAQELADHTGLDKMIVSRAVRNLEAQGRLVRESNEADRRLRHLYLTASGWDVYTEIGKHAARRESQLYEALDASELRKFQQLLLKLCARARELGSGL